MGPSGDRAAAVGQGGLLLRLDRLSAAAHKAAEAIAIIGARARHDTLRDICDLPEAKLALALEELRARGMVTEDRADLWPVYDFRHPLARQIVVGEIALARQALLHARVAGSLEAAYGPLAEEHADELALHYSRGSLTGGSSRAVPYLAAAGRRALGRCADREAVNYLRLALAGAEEGESGRILPDRGTQGSRADRLGLMEDLGRALRRVGDVEGAVRVWEAAADEASEKGEDRAFAGLLRRIGLARFFAGEHARAPTAYDRALPAARRTGDARVLGRVLVAMMSRT